MPFPVVAGFLGMVGSSILKSAFVVNAGASLADVPTSQATHLTHTELGYFFPDYLRARLFTGVSLQGRTYYLQGSL